MNTEQLMTEEAAAEATGIALADVRKLRRGMMQAGADYSRGNGGRIIFTASGMERLVASVAGLAGKKEVRPQVSAIVEHIEEGRSTILVETLVPNPHLLIGRIPGEKTTVRVRVRNSALFTRGMALAPCRRISETIYEFCGSAPRRRGVW